MKFWVVITIVFGLHKGLWDWWGMMGWFEMMNGEGFMKKQNIPNEFGKRRQTSF